MEPIAIAALMQVYFKEIEGQTPNADGRHGSNRFRAASATWVKGVGLGTDRPHPSLRHERQSPCAIAIALVASVLMAGLYTCGRRCCCGKLVQSSDAAFASWRSSRILIIMACCIQPPLESTTMKRHWMPSLGGRTRRIPFNSPFLRRYCVGIRDHRIGSTLVKQRRLHRAAHAAGWNYWIWNSGHLFYTLGWIQNCCERR